MIKLGKYNCEYFASSGALGYDGKGYIWEYPLKFNKNLFDPNLFIPITKTITYKLRKGNFCWYKPWESIRFIENGVVNSIGLDNPGFNWWYKKYRHIRQIASIYSENTIELFTMISQLNQSNVIAIEINESCPNVYISSSEKIIEDCYIAKKMSNKPIILKLSVLHNLNDIIPNISNTKIDAISINSVPWNYIFKNKSPLEKYGGGAVSGKIIQKYTWKFMQEIIKLSDFPVIGPSIWEYDDMHKLTLLGADGFGFGSIFLRYPWRPTQYVTRWKNGKD